MLFYKVEGMLVKDVGNPDSARERREYARKIMVKSDSFNQEKGRDSFCFVSAVADGLLTAGIIVKNADNIDRLARSYLEYIDCVMSDMTITEITISGMQQFLFRANHANFIDNDDEICERFGIDRVMGRRGRNVEFGENIIELSAKKTVFSNAGKYLMGKTLIPELERIYACHAPKNMQGHPVHYILETDSPDTRRETCRLLMRALYANGRLRSRRYCYVDFRPGESFSSMAYDDLYNISEGGAIIVRYLANDDSEEDNFANGERDTIDKICQAAKKHRNKVLTIICLPFDCKKTKKIFYENLGAMSFVEVSEDFTAGEQAKAFLKMLAKDNHIRCDKKLYANLEDGKSYLASDLHRMFEEWYDDKLKTAVYPQYKDVKSVSREEIKSAPKGSSYEELQEMIGLTEAKNVIRKALNYYKMQKLFEDKGIKKDSPAMHMVFTGNPGTAKTTAARLFAGIMKDNGLLTRGHLVEVGRGDLVGRYVGWTAKTVQAKFKAAIGGVLFIDEAYSLVDDRSGSFGDEAINTIVQEMENHREDVVVIFAGYPNEMEKFMQKNPGLRSRIAFHVPFVDYNADELCKIATLMAKNKGVIFDDAAMEKLWALFESASKQRDFGNGRYVRNVLEQAKMNQASRLLEYDFDDITADVIRVIKAEDIIMPELKAETKRTIGFAC